MSGRATNLRKQLRAREPWATEGQTGSRWHKDDLES